VKRFFIAIPLTLLVFSVLVPAICRGQQTDPAAAGKTTDSPAVQPQAERKPADVNTPSDVNTPADPNDERRRKLAKRLEEAIEKLEPENQAEIREWMQGEVERKTNLMRAVHNRRTVEYQLLRELAVKEGAEETVAAIDKLIERTNSRYEKITKRYADERRNVRRQQLKEKREQQRQEKERRREERRDSRRRDVEERRDRSSRRSRRESDTDR